MTFIHDKIWPYYQSANFLIFCAIIIAYCVLYSSVLWKQLKIFVKNTIPKNSSINFVTIRCYELYQNREIPCKNPDKFYNLYYTTTMCKSQLIIVQMNKKTIFFLTLRKCFNFSTIKSKRSWLQSTVSNLFTATSSWFTPKLLTRTACSRVWPKWKFNGY